MKFVPKRLERTADVSRGDTTWVSFLKNALSVVIVFALGYLALGLLADLLAHSIPDRWEARIWGPTTLTPPETEEWDRARETFERLVAHGDLRDLPYELSMALTHDPNAFALPGGAVTLTKGLIESVESEAGLAFVLAHELGHHEQRHALRRIGRRLVFSVARGLLFDANPTSVVDATLHLAESGYSRRQETEADEFGLRLVHEVYGDTQGCLEFFEQIEESPDERWVAFARSHPLTSERIDTLRRLQAELSGAGER
ncbi:MAG: M48 family metalloprotease [bacterium]|nr:M48 family metalloprotease [bacterium]